MSKTSLKDYAEDVERCMRCGFCRALCPTWEFISWETGSPRGRMQLVKALLEGEVKTNRYLMERIYGCALCGYCTWRCPPGIKTLDVIKAARAYLMDANCYPREIDRIIGNLETNKSIYDIPKEERAPLGRTHGSRRHCTDREKRPRSFTSQGVFPLTPRGL